MSQPSLAGPRGLIFPHLSKSGADSDVAAGRIVRRGFWPLSAAIFLLPLTFLAVGCKKQASPSTETPSPAPRNALELVFPYGSEKEKWITDVTSAFNRSGAKSQSGKTIFVLAVPLGSGETIDNILSGRMHAHLASPASAAFIKLGNGESRAKTGKDLIAATDNLVLSPVVIAM